MKNEKGVKFTQNFLSLSDIEKNHNIINSTLFRRDVKRKFITLTGLWKVELRHMGKLILFKKFLVISDNETVFEESKSEWLNLFEKYWSFDSICVKSIENIQTNQTYSHGKFFKSCMDDGAEWSTFYPDPKSDIDNLGIDLKLRI
jgi:hypothetical protein